MLFFSVLVVCVEFPVKRRLLRPCISLTAVVQAGRGKYHASAGGSGNDIPTSESIPVNVDACTFDRVLLYLEHEARGDEFKFDPLIAPELLAAAETLNILGLQEACQKVLGSFKVLLFIYILLRCNMTLLPCVCCV